MAAIVRSACVLLTALLPALAVRADEASDAMATVNHVATALSANEPYQAIAYFDNSFPDYDKLRNYFIGLTGAYNVTNEATIVDEQESAGAVKISLQWTLTLTQPNSPVSKRRQSEVQVRLIRKNRKWRIASFSPIEIFNPALSGP